MSCSARTVRKVILLVFTELSEDVVACTLEAYEPQLGEEEDDDGPVVIGGKLVQELVCYLRGETGVETLVWRGGG